MDQLHKSYINQRTFLLNISKKILKDESLAEDVLHDVYERAFSFDMYDRLNHMEEKELLSYLVSMLKNRAHNVYRKRYHETDFTTLQLEEGFIEEDQDDMVEKIMDQFLFKEVKKELKNLPESYELVLNLRYQYQFSHKEIAKMLEENETTVRKRLERATIKLKELCGKYQ